MIYKEAYSSAKSFQSLPIVKLIILPLVVKKALPLPNLYIVVISDLYVHPYLCSTDKRPILLNIDQDFYAKLFLRSP